jgi:hypothetical protein
MACAGAERRAGIELEGEFSGMKQYRPLLACALAAILLGWGAALLAAESSVVRDLPYPYAHTITFAGDADEQAPWHGAAIHRVLNEEIGLPVTSSVWVQGADSSSSFFAGGLDLKDGPSGVGAHTVWGLMLRQWHRGNADHLHSWQDDAVPPLVEILPEPRALQSAVTVVKTQPAPVSLTSFGYRHLRLYFSAPPPEDLALLVRDANGQAVKVPARPIVLSVAGSNTGGGAHAVEVILGAPPGLGVPLTGPFNLALLRSIELIAPSCAKGCAAALVRIDRDAFSRRTVLAQMPWIKALNVRPLLFTSHGGWSQIQNLGSPGFTWPMERTPGSIYESPLVPNVLRALANDPGRHAYHSDLLRRLGVRVVWHTAGSSRHYWNVPVPPLSSTTPGFYDFVRTEVAPYDTSSRERFLHDVHRLDPALRGIELDDVYCSKTCGGDQGAVVGLLIALSLSQVDASKRPVDYVWYTHFASGDADFRRSAETPLRASAVSWFRRLANYHYNFDGKIEQRRRVWVPPSGVVARYRFVHPEVARHTSVDRDTSRVSIESWKDRVTETTIPDPVTGTRDLHGITIYVPDSRRASVDIAGRETLAFTRNPPDESGRPSITLVDDSTPTTLVDELPLWALGTVTSEGGTWSEPEKERPGAPRGKTFGILTATHERAVLRWKPHRLDIRNTTHLQFAYRKRADEAIRSSGLFFVELEMADGSIVTATESAATGGDSARSIWKLDSARSGEWSNRVLAHSDLLWGASVRQGRPGLPIGRVREVRFGLTGASAGEHVDVDMLRLLRPNGTGAEANGRLLLAGQVTDSGRPVQSAIVESIDAHGKRASALTDRHGYYFFFRQPADAVYRLAARANGKRCAPSSGSLLHLMKDEAEVDFDMSSCK